MGNNDIEMAIEGILFAAGEPVPASRLAVTLGIDVDDVLHAAETLADYYTSNNRGIRLVRLEDSLQLCSAPDCAEWIRAALEKRKAPQLSQTALEVLAVIAYYQPVTRAYIEAMRGVDSTYTVGTLQSRGLIEQCGVLNAPGRPALFRTTKGFLRTFGIAGLEELPPLPEQMEDSRLTPEAKPNQGDGQLQLSGFGMGGTRPCEG